MLIGIQTRTLLLPQMSDSGREYAAYVAQIVAQKLLCQFGNDAEILLL